jgi:hypothetical protein
MGIVDKLKQGAEQAKTMAAQAAERAKEEARELNLKRQINNEEEQLGSIVVGLVERGEISHAELQPGVDRIKALRAELETAQAGTAEEPAPTGGEDPLEATPGEPGSADGQ